MAGDRDVLEAITREILKPDRALSGLIPQAQALRDFFEGITHFTIDPTHDIAAGQTRLDSGLAISPTLAAMCLREQFRTLAFIRGLAAAIDDARCPDRPVRVLYAGCGPFALLAVPLMTAFSPAQARFTLLDIHQECVVDAVSLIHSLGLSVHIDGAICADATRYEIPTSDKPDVIVSETMAVCLHNEPQVSIARNLLMQAPGARMVPSSVSIDMCLLDWSKEHLLMPAEYVGEIPAPQRDRIHLGRIFELNDINIRSWHGIEGDRLPAGRVRFPESLESRYRPYLMTSIDVFGLHRLQDYDSSLTTPMAFRTIPELAGGEMLQFHYQLGSNPELRYDVLH
jgi:hypothetical protein